MKNKYIFKEMRIISIFSIITLISVLVINFMSLYHVNTMYKITEDIYSHPLKASSTALSIQHTFETFNIINIFLVILILSIFGVFMIYIRNRLHKYMNMLASNEEKYKNLSERFSLAVDGTNDGLWDWNIKENTVYFSPRWKAMIGFKDDELANEFDSWESRVHPDDLKEAKEKIKLSHEKPDVEYIIIHRLLHKDGSWVWILDRGQTIFDENGEAIRMLGFHTDITAQKKLEKELLDKDEIMIAQSRHAAMGEMISMIAHQWRQPISVIAMDANNILVDIELDLINKDELSTISKDIILQTSELSKTIDDFRDFFKPNKYTEVVILKEVIDDTLSILGKSLENNNIKIMLNIDENIEITTYSRELIQVLINLIKNAKEALIEKELESKTIHLALFQKNECAIITISDNAGGISETIIGKIFDPYFTTKGEKNGTGLGLYMSKTIIEKHLYGTIIVRNIQEGAQFEIKLPLNYEG